MCFLQVLLATLLLGQLHNLISRSMYHQMRLVVSLGNMKLPHWDTIQNARSRIRKILKMDIVDSETILLNKCTTLSIKDIIGHVSQYS